MLLEADGSPQQRQRGSHVVLKLHELRLRARENPCHLSTPREQADAPEKSWGWRRHSAIYANPPTPLFLAQLHSQPRTPKLLNRLPLPSTMSPNHLQKYSWLEELV